MDFTLSKKHEMARQLFKEFAENEVKPLAQEVDETEHFPEETVAKMQKLGFMGIPVPKEYGGQGCYLKFVVQQVLLYPHIHHYVQIQFLLMVLKNRNRNILFHLQRVKS